MKNCKVYILRNLLKAWMICIVSIIIFASCRSYTDADKSKQTIEEEAEMLVFYEYGTEGILDNFVLEHPDIQLKKYRFGGIEEELSRLILTEGKPDLILLNLSMSKDEDEVIEKNYAADIYDLYLEDFSVEAEKYFPGTFEVCKQNDEMYGLPLGISIRMMTLREENWQGSAFELLKESYTALDLFKAIEYEIDREKEQGVFFSVDSMMGGSLYHILQLVGGVQKNNGHIIIDEELFAQIYAIKYKQSESDERALTYWEMQKYEMPTGIGDISGLDPRRYSGKFIVSDWYERDGAPQICLSYATSVNEYFFKQKTHALYYPVVEDGDTFGASVEIMGLVGTDSERKKEAYDILRLMMDTPITVFSQPGGIFGNTFCPVNKENAYALMEAIEEEAYHTDEESMIIQDGTGNILYTMEKILINEEEKRRLQNVLEGISFLYRFSEEERRSNEIMNQYFNEKRMENYRFCYLEIMQMLNPEDEEWVLSGEELANYLNGGKIQDYEK